MARITGLVVASFLGIIALFSMFGSWYTIDQGERGVLLRNGAIVGAVDPGLGFKVPFIDSVQRISTRQYTLQYENVQAYSKDQQTATLRLSVTVSVPGDKVPQVYSGYGTYANLVERTLNRQVNEQVEIVFGRFNAITAVQDRATLSMEVSNAIKKVVYGPLTVHSVQVENIDFSDAYEKSIEQRMQAEVEVQKLRQNAEREKVQAEIVVTQAKAKADAVRAEAIAKADAIKATGEAEATAIRARGDALKENPGVVALTQAERWNGQLPTTMVPGGAVPFLEVRP